LAKSLLIERGGMLRPGQTSDLIEDLRKEKGRILLRQHFALCLKVFLAGFVLAVLSAIPVVYAAFRAEIRVLQDQITNANERRSKWEEETKRQTQVAEHYRDRFLTITKTNGNLSGFSHEDLQEYALRMVKALRTPIREHETAISKLDADVTTAMLAKPNADDLKKILEERATLEWEAGQRCMAVYNIRLKADVLALRREILSRIPVGNDIDRNGLPTDYWYDSPWNFYGFKRMVADLDRITKELPASNAIVKKRVN